MPIDVVDGLAALERPPVGWPIDRVSLWPSVAAGVSAFAERWDSLARDAGWSTLQLYSLHRRAPWANLAGMGAGFVIAIGRYHVLHVERDLIAIATPTGSRLYCRRHAPDPDALPAWLLT